MIKKLTHLGSSELAYQVADRAYQEVLGFKRFLNDQGHAKLPKEWEKLPQMDKDNYIDKYDNNDLLISNRRDIISFYRSSGFSRKSTYWPKLVDAEKQMARSREALNGMFDLANQRTLHVVAMSLGSWIGGDSLSYSLKAMFSDCDYQSTVYSPGNDYRDCVESIVRFREDFDSIIVYITPSSISELFMMAGSLRLRLPRGKMKFVVAGEMFPESLRSQIHEDVPVEQRPMVMTSVYAAADTGVLGIESPFSSTMRQILQDDAIRSELGFVEGLPLLHHQFSDHVYYECIDQQLVLTLWQGIPLVRYNIKDRVDLYSWPELKSQILAFRGMNSDLRPAFDLLSQAPDDLPDVVAVYGRADQGVIVSGSNIGENTLNQAVRASLHGISDGKYRAEVIFGHQNNQRLQITIEVPDSRAISEEQSGQIRRNIAEQLCRLQGEFAVDYRQRFADQIDDPELSIITVKIVDWPYFSKIDGGCIKHRSIGR